MVLSTQIANNSVWQACVRRLLAPPGVVGVASGTQPLH